MVDPADLEPCILSWMVAYGGTIEKCGVHAAVLPVEKGLVHGPPAQGGAPPLIAGAVVGVQLLDVRVGVPLLPTGIE